MTKIIGVVVRDTGRKWKRADITDTMVCRAVNAYHKARKQDPKCVVPFPYEILELATGAPQKVAWAAIVRAHDHGLIEFGTTLRTGWLTDTGKALLAEWVASC